jgi:ribosomal protein L12E/L44/L45/RPP1/RPP2
VQEQQQLWNRDGKQGQCFGTLTIGFDSGVAASSGSSIRGTLLLARELWQENVRDQLLQLAVASAALVSARSPSTSGSLAAIPEEQSEEEEEEEEEAEEEEEGDLLEEMIAAADDELRTNGEGGREAAAGSAYHSAHSTTPLPAPMLAAGNVTLAASPAYGLGTPLPLLSGSADPRLLSFLDEGEERDFERYHASRMVKVGAPPVLTHAAGRRVGLLPLSAPLGKEAPLQC